MDELEVIELALRISDISVQKKTLDLIISVTDKVRNDISIGHETTIKDIVKLKSNNDAKYKSNISGDNDSISNANDGANLDRESNEGESKTT